MVLLLLSISLKSEAQVGSALSFDGSNDYVAVNNPFTAFQKEITVEWWVYIVPNTTYTLGSGIGQGTVGIDNMSNNVWLMHFNGSGSILQFYVNDAGTWRTHNGVSIPSGWHHIAGVADPTGTRLFVDGVLAAPVGQGITTGIWSNPNAKMHFGKDVRFNTSRFMPGTMDEIRIWSRAICQGELQNNKFCEIPGSAPNLEGNYHFNQGVAGGNNSTETTLFDASGNNRHGSLIDMGLTGSTSNWVTPGGIVNGTNCTPFAYPTATITASGPTNFCNGGSVILNANTNASFTYQWKKNNINIPGATGSTYTANTAGDYTVTITNLGCSGTSTPTNVVVYTADKDGDNIADVCDLDDDNDGILDEVECNVSNFYWSNPPTVNANGTSASGTINGIAYTYNSSRTVTTTSNLFAHSVFPSSYNIPNTTTIRNDYISTNTLTFASPMKNPVLVFSSIGGGPISVPIEFNQPIEVLWKNSTITVNSPTRITGQEGYAIVRLNGTYSSIGFNYLADETYVNFVFGADFTTCGDTDNDGTPDYADIDSDNDGCSDAVEGGAGFLLTQTVNNRLSGGVNASGVPLIAGAGQTIGTSKTASANCSCQANIDRITPSVGVNNITVNLDAAGNASITAAQVNNGSTDACGIAEMTLSKSTFNCSNVGTNNVVLSVKDNNGNIGTATSIVTVVDAIAPTVVTQNISINLGTSGNTTITATQINNGSSDNCSIASYSLSKTTFDCSNIGQNTVTLTVTDVNGNSKTGTAIVTVVGADTDGDGVADACDLDDDNDGILDVTECNKSNFFWSNPPQINGRFATGTINGIGYTYESSVAVGWTTNVYNHSIFPGQYNVPNSNPTIRNDYISTNTLSFATPMKNPVLVFSSIGNPNKYVPIEFDQPIQILWSTAVTQNSATKITGNEGYAIIRLTGTYSSIGFRYLADESWVNFVFGADFTTCGDTDGDGTPDYVDLDSDNDGCSDAIEGSLSFAVSQTSNNRLIGGVNAQGVPLLAGSGQGLGTSQSFIANCFCQPTIDKTLPTVITKDVTIALSASGSATVSAAQINNGSTDNCGISTITLSQTSFNCSNLGPNTVTLSVKDINNNVATGTATVTVIDNINPQITCTSNIQKTATGANGSVVTYNAPSGSDNCSYTITQTAGLASGAIFPIGTTTNSFEIVDASGNKATCSFNVTVVGVAPQIVSPGTINVFSNANSCDAIATYSATETAGIPASTITYSIAPGSSFAVGTTPVTATATNAVGTSQVSFNVVVTDNVMPSINCSSNIDVYATSAAGATVNYTAPTGSDNCAYTITQIAGSASGSTFPIGTTTNTFEIVDASGNKATCSFDVTVTGIPPVIVSPGTITASSDANSCSAVVNYAATETTAIPASTITYSIAPGSVFNVGTTPVTATATNAVGSSQVTFDVVVSDNTAPTAIAQNVSIALSANGTASITAADINNNSSDACGIASISIDKTSFDCSNVGSNPVVLTVTDIHGNSSTASANVQVSDVTPPTAVAQNLSIALSANGTASITAADVNNNSSDACGIANISINKTTFDCSNVGSNAVVLTVTDVNGNSSTANAIVTVSDVTSPTAIAQNLTVTLNSSGYAGVTAAQVNNGSSDACGIANISIDKADFNCSNIGVNNIVLTVTDVNGNSSTANATVTVNGFISTCSITATANTSGTVIGSATTYAATNQMFLGYGAQSMRLNCTAVNGGPFRYQWTGSGLSNTSIANPIFTPTAGGNYTLTCAVTNSTGCVTTCSITICVIDVRAAGGSPSNPKVLLCHVPPGNSNNPQTLSISISAVPSHLGLHAGDRLGSCNSTCNTSARLTSDGDIYTFESATSEIDLIVYPNPSSSNFNFILESESDETVSIRIYDVTGRLIEELNNQLPNTKIELGSNLMIGSYMADVIQGENRKTVKLIKLN